MASQNTLALMDHSFDRDVLESEVRVLVDFWGKGCPSCREMAPDYRHVAEEYARRVRVGKLDVGSDSNTTMRYYIRGFQRCYYSRAAASLSRR